MKKKLFSLGFSFAAFISTTLTANAYDYNATSDNICPEFKHLADVSMTARQHGTPIGTILKGTKGAEFIKIVEKAYEYPIAADRKGKTEAIDKFTKEIDAECRKEFDKDTKQ